MTISDVYACVLFSFARSFQNPKKRLPPLSRLLKSGTEIMAIGTRQSSRTSNNAPASRSISQSFTRDAGMSKLANGPMTFDTATARVTLAGAFQAFEVHDRIMVEGTNLNNGFFDVTGTGAGNYLTISPAPKTEVTATAVIRTV